MQYQAPKYTGMDKSILDSVMKQTGIKRENDLYSDLNSRLHEENNTN